MNTTSSQEASLTNILTGMGAGLLTAALALVFGQYAQAPLVGIGVGVIFFLIAPMLGHLQHRWAHLDAFDDLSLSAARLRERRIRSLVANSAGLTLVSYSSPDREEFRLRSRALLDLHDQAPLLLAQLEEGYQDLKRALSLDFKMTPLQEELFGQRQAELDSLARQLMEIEAKVNSWVLTGSDQMAVYSYVEHLNSPSRARSLIKGWEDEVSPKKSLSSSSLKTEPYRGSERHHALLETHMHRSTLS